MAAAGVPGDAGRKLYEKRKSDRSGAVLSAVRGKNNMRKKNTGRLLPLFLSMLYISAFTFGGGFVIVTFMKRKFVDEYHWIDEQEMLDMTALAQSSPGPIAVNAAILVGWKTAGFAGMAAAVLGTVIPPVVILSVVSLFPAYSIHHACGVNRASSS